MLQISKCPNMRVVLTYWEALRDVSELSYKSLLYFSSNGSYCNCICNFANVLQKALNKYEMRKWEILITHFGGFGSPFCLRAPSIFYQRTQNISCKIPYSLLTTNCMPVSCMSACIFLWADPVFEILFELNFLTILTILTY